MAYSVGTVTVDVAPSLRNFHKKIKAEVARVGGFEVPISPDLDGFHRDLKARAESIAKATGVDVEVDADTALAERKVASVGRGRTASIDADADTALAERKLDAAAWARTAGIKVKVFGDKLLDKSLPAVGGIARSLASVSALAGAATVAVAGVAPSVAAVGVAATKATVAVGGLTAAMAPAALGSAVLGLGTLKFAISGIKGVLEATDFESAVTELDPASQKAARAVRDLRSEFLGLKDQVSESLFSSFTNIGELSALISPVGAAMDSLAASMGRVAADFTSFITAGVGLSAFNTMLSASSQGAANLSAAVGEALKGVTLIGAVGAPLFAQLAQRINEAASAWSDRMITAFNDGSMQAWFDSAIAKTQAFWAVLQQLGGIVSGVFRAMMNAGGGVLAVFGDAIAKTNEWVNSAPGMAAMTGFFRDMQSAAAAVAPVIGRIATIIITQLAPIMADVFRTLAPYAEEALDNISRALTALAPAIPNIAKAFGELAIAVTDLLVPLAHVIDFISPIAPALTPVVLSLVGFAGAVKGVNTAAKGFTAVKSAWDTLSNLPGVTKAASGAMSVLKNSFKGVVSWAKMAPAAIADLGRIVGGPFKTAILGVGRAAKMLGPALVQVGVAIKTACVGAIQLLIRGFTMLWGVMVANPVIAVIAAIVAIGVALWAFFTKTELGREIWSNFVNFLKELWQSIVTAATATWSILTEGWNALWGHITSFATSAWATITALWNGFWNGLVTVVTTIGAMIVTTWGFIVQGLQLVFQFFVTLVTTIWNVFWNGLVTVVTFVGTLITTAWNMVVTGLQMAFQFFVTLATTIWNSFWNGLVTVASALGAAISAAWSILWNGVRVVFSAVVDFLRLAWTATTSVLISLAQRVRQLVSNAFNALRSAVTSTVTAMWSATKTAFSTGVAAVVSFVAQLPGRIRGFFASAGSWLIGAGRNIMQGLLNGISSMVGAVIGKIRSVAGSIKSAFTGLLGIHSPSRVFMGYGANLAEGLAVGVDDNQAVAESSAQQLAATTDSALDAALPTAKTITPSITADAGKTTVKATAAGSPAVLGKQMQKARRSLIDPAARGIARSMQSMGAAVVGATLGQAAPSMLQLAATTGTAAANVQHSTAGVMSAAFTQTGQNMVTVQQGQIEPALRATRDSVAQTAGSFGPAAQMIGAQWAQVRPATADPVRFAINTVFNDGIVGMWNSVSGLLGTKKMAPYIAKFASGGYVSGPGGATDDKIPAMLSNGEYVIKADTVRRVGVSALDRLNAGPRRYPGVVHGQAGREMYNDLTFQNVAVRRQGGGIAEGTPAWEALKRAHLFARKWSPRPYVWGGSLGANNGTDCSGWVSSIADVILGGNGMVRKWATMSFPGPQQGAWKSGLAAGFSVGISNVHTAGTLSGVAGFPTVNVESGGNTGQGPTYGGRAVGADHPQFPRKYSLIITDMGAFIPGGGGSAMSMGEMVASMMKPAKDKMTAAINGFGGRGLVGAVPAAIAGKLGEAVTKKATSLAESADGGPEPAGSGAERWRPMAMRAMARVGLDASNKAQVDAMIAQIASESGGNAGVAQQIHDVNGTGESAGVGLLQIIPGTFAAYRDPALPNNRRDPFANMVAALRYYKSRYGTDLTSMWGHGHGYDQGGWLAPGVQTVYNGFRKPEAVLSPSESEAFVGVARRFVDDDRVGSQFVGQHVENQYVVDPDELSWRTERSVKRAMRLEGIRA